MSTFDKELNSFFEKFTKHSENYTKTLEEEEKKEREESYVPNGKSR